MSAETEALLARLDSMVAILKIGFASELGSIRKEVHAEKVGAAILTLLEDSDGWVGSGEIQRTVSKSATVAERTVRARLADLLALGVLRSRGGGRSTEYSLSGLI